MRVKICGITRLEDALVAEAAGADAIGFVFYEPSPRSVSATTAVDIVSKLPPFISTVGLFVNPTAEQVFEVLSQVPVDVLQFHGDEPAEFCQQFNKPWIKALKVKGSQELVSALTHYTNANAVLLDTFDENLAGGTGKTFDWNLIPEDIQVPWVLAGGLTVENLADALNRCTPWAVDVSGGVESSKGIKDAEKVTDFIRQAKTIDSNDLSKQ